MNLYYSRHPFLYNINSLTKIIFCLPGKQVLDIITMQNMFHLRGRKCCGENKIDVERTKNVGGLYSHVGNDRVGSRRWHLNNNFNEVAQNYISVREQSLLWSHQALQMLQHLYQEKKNHKVQETGQRYHWGNYFSNTVKNNSLGQKRPVEVLNKINICNIFLNSLLF